MYMLLMEGNLKRCMYMYIIVHNTKKVKGLIRADDSHIGGYYNHISFIITQCIVVSSAAIRAFV